MSLSTVEELYDLIDHVRTLSFPTGKYLLVSWCKHHGVSLTRGLVDQLRPPIRYLPTPY